MRANSYIGCWLISVLVLIVAFECVTSYPADESISAVSSDSRPFTAAARKQSNTIGTINNNKQTKKNNKKKRQQQQKQQLEELHHHHHSSRGLKQALDYDYAVQRSADVGADAVQPKTAKASRSPWSGQRQRDIKKKSNRKPNAKAKRAGKRNDGKQRRQATVRTARRAATFNDDIVTDDGQETTDPLLGLGVFGDMRKFFDELRSNLDVEAVAAEAAAAAAERGVTKDDSLQGTGLEDYEDLPNYQALRTAVGFDNNPASPVQQQRRYSRLRGFVAMGGPGSSGESSRHHRTHPYDPALLWTGLGRRR